MPLCALLICMVVHTFGLGHLDCSRHVTVADRCRLLELGSGQLPIEVVGPVISKLDSRDGLFVRALRDVDFLALRKLVSLTLVRTC